MFQTDLFGLVATGFQHRASGLRGWGVPVSRVIFAYAVWLVGLPFAVLAVGKDMDSSILAPFLGRINKTCPRLSGLCLRWTWKDRAAGHGWQAARGPTPSSRGAWGVLYRGIDIYAMGRSVVYAPPGSL